MMRSVITASLLLGVLAGCGSDRTTTDSTDEPSTAPTTFDVSGIVTLIDSGNYASGGKGTECVGTGGFDDMAGGTGVVVYSSTGERVGVGSLKSGIKRDSVTCEFGFFVSDVPISETSDIYSVEVSHRGEVTFKKDAADDLALTLSGS